MTSASTQDGTHPRPQLIRAAHLALDRRCGFAYDDADRGLSEGWQARADVFDREILLPFAPESDASGIGDTGYHPIVWYRIVLTAADLRVAGWREQGERLLIHLGAVDYAADVWVDGIHVARHVGGQTMFSADITDALATGADDHVVVLRAEDDPLDVTMPRGKQDWQNEPHGIWYHRTTGIWRTVWLEAVPATYVRALAWTPNVPEAAVRLELELSQRPKVPTVVEVRLAHGDQQLARLAADVSDGSVTLTIPITSLTNGQHFEHLLWSPEHPLLIDATVTLSVQGDQPDVVDSYLGLRSVGTADRRFLLNGRPYYLRSVLEQGYWPGSHFTAPSPSAMRDEAELIRGLGFNALRIHQKVEDPRFLYWCDRLGLLVWAETASAYAFNDVAVQRLADEWISIVRQYRSHPSIVTWVPFNESWGIQHGPADSRQRAYAIGLVNLTRALDPSRPVISNDGWEHTDSDIWTFHDYEGKREVLQARYGSWESIDEMIRGIGPAGRRMSLTDVDDITAPAMLTEFGGISFVTGQTPASSWGYTEASDATDFEQRLRAVLEPIHAAAGLAGFCYTQLTDTLQETNGLCDAERHPKLPLETLTSIIRGRG